MRFIDISVGISGDMPVWPGDGEVIIEKVAAISDNQEMNLSRISCTVHTGTHIDAPYHYFDEGITVDAIPLKKLIGRAYVIDLTHAAVINEQVLEESRIPPRTRRVLIKTKNSAFWSSGRKTFTKDFVSIDPTGASWLVKKGVHLVGIDYLSVSSFDDPAPTHRILLGSEVFLLEGLDLSDVDQGRYTLYCLPMKILKADGAPARALLAGV